MNTEADWLRSEIEKLEGSKRKLPKDAVEMMGVLGVAEEKLRNFGYNTAITSIITRYKEELKVLESDAIKLDIAGNLVRVNPTPWIRD